MKILYVSQYFPPEMGAPAARVAELTRRWAREGHDVTVLTGFPNHPTGKVAAEYRKAFRRLVMKENLHGVKIVRTWLWPLPNGTPYQRMLNYTSFCVSSSLVGMFLERPDVVIATSPQLLVGLSGWFLARCKHSSLVFEVRDLWPESLAAVGVGNRKSVLYRILASIAAFLYRKADRVVVVTMAFKDYLVERLHVPANKISVVQNGVESDLFAPNKNGETLRGQLRLEGKFLVAYLGTMGMAHGLDTLLQAAAGLQATHPEIVFLFVGEGSDKERIRAIAVSNHLTNVQFVDEQPREKIPDYISASDVCVVLLRKDEIFKTVIPTKMLEFMACARPVILGVDGEARGILEEAKAGVYVQPGNVGELTDAIIRVAADITLRSELGKNGRKFIMESFSRSQTASLYMEILQSMVEEPIARSVAA